MRIIRFWLLCESLGREMCCLTFLTGRFRYILRANGLVVGRIYFVCLAWCWLMLGKQSIALGTRVLFESRARWIPLNCDFSWPHCLRFSLYSLLKWRFCMLCSLTYWRSLLGFYLGRVWALINKTPGIIKFIAMGALELWKDWLTLAHMGVSEFHDDIKKSAD